MPCQYLIVALFVSIAGAWSWILVQPIGVYAALTACGDLLRMRPEAPDSDPFELMWNSRSSTHVVRIHWSKLK